MENAQKRPDRRVIKTKKAIRNAFAQLVAQKDIGGITIKDIADAADINRKTFYSYYAGVPQIVEEIEDEIITMFVGALNDIDFTTALQDPYSIFTRLVSCINNDLDFYSNLFKNGTDRGLIKKITDVLKLRIKQAFSRQIALDPVKLDMVADFAMSGAVSVFQSWFGSKQEVPLEKYCDWMSILTIRGVTGLLMTPDQN